MKTVTREDWCIGRVAASQFACDCLVVFPHPLLFKTLLKLVLFLIKPGVTGMKVLVVDDDSTCLFVLKRMLHDCKYDVTICSQATRALSMLRENRCGFNVLISNVHMPDMDGFRLLELVGLEMDLPVIMMSADSSTNAVMKGIKHGACDYLIKPVRMEELRNIWQHVVRKKWSENKDHDRSGSIDDMDRNIPANSDNEYASSANDVGDGNGKSQKKKRDKEEDESDENGDPSTSKKSRVVWSVELHQQFVNAVNHLGIDKAVPKSILELMNVPGLTRENVASHLQKFRLYLKRIAQHHAGIAHPFIPSASSATVAPLGGLALQALAASDQIPPQALAVLQDELLGQPTRSLELPGRDQSSLQLAAIKGNTPHGEREIAFGQPIYKCPSNAYGAFPQSSPTVGGMPPFAAWPSNKHGMADSGHMLGSLNNSQNNSMLLQELQQQPDTLLPGTLHSIDVKPSGLVMPSQSLNTFPSSGLSLSPNQNPLVMPPQSSSFLGAIPSSMKHKPVLTTSQLSSSLLGGIGMVNQASTSQPLINNHGGNLPGLMNRSSNAMSTQGISNFEGGPYVASHNAVRVSSKPQGVLKTESTDSLSHSYGYVGGNSSMDSGLLSQSKTPQFGLLQSRDDVCSWSSLQNVDNYGCTLGPGQSGSTSSNFQSSNLALGRLSDQGQGMNHGFVGNGTCIPSRFAVDEIESPTNNLSHSIGSSVDIGNPTFFGFSGQM